MKRLNKSIIILLGIVSASFALAVTKVTVPTLFWESNAGSWEHIQGQMKYGQEKHFILNWAGRGGRIYLGVNFINSMTKAQNQGKYILIKVRGNTWSMHSLAACFASEVQISNKNIFFMYHSAGNKKIRENNSQYKWMFDECVRKGYAPSNVYELVQQGYEVYYYPLTHKTKIAIDSRRPE